jgi:hypothetical protein
MRPGGSGILAALLALAVPAPAALNLSLSGDSLALPGQAFSLVLVVQNTSPSSLQGVDATLRAAGLAPGAWSQPAPSDLPAFGSVSFTWALASAGCGDLVFSASAVASDGVAGVSGASLPWQLHVSCSPMTTPTLTPLAKPGLPQGSASIPGNLFHPGSGQPLQLRYTMPVAGLAQVDLYDRLGRHLRHFERTVDAGASAEDWDGRDDQGVELASGIYIARFHGPGLEQTLKFAVIK